MLLERRFQKFMEEQFLKSKAIQDLYLFHLLYTDTVTMPLLAM